MHVVLKIVAVLIGLFLLFIYFRSIVRVVLLNRRERDVVGRFAGLSAIAVFHALAGEAREHDRVQRLQAWTMPLYIFIAVVIWFLLVQVAFMFILIGTGVENRWAHAFSVSGSALSTLGFATPPGLLGQFLAIYEAGIGLAIVILLFTFVPGYQAAIQVRERRVGWLYSRTGQHPNAVSLLQAQQRAGELKDSSWEPWEAWFRGVLETHSLSPVLCYVPSIYRGTNWVGAAAAVLDTTSLVLAALEPQHTNGARLCRESGVMAVQTIAQEIAGNERVIMQAGERSDPLPDFGRLYDQLKSLGLPVTASQDACREAFIKLRSEYEPSLHYLSKTTLMPIEPPTFDRPQPSPQAHPPIV